MPRIPKTKKRTPSPPPSSSSSSSSTTIYFFGPTNPHGHFSQHFPCLFTSSDSHVYTSTEQYMMHRKALLFAPTSSYPSQILSTTNPRACKALGREVPGFDPKVWNQHRERIVEEGNWYKFSQDEGLKKLLLETGERELVEAAPRDRVWGIGFGKERAEGMRERWGLNLLGKCLERVRRRLREEEGKEGEGEV